MAVIEDAQHLHHEATPSESPSQRSSTISSNPSAGTVRDGSSGNSALTSETGMCHFSACGLSITRLAAG